MRDSSSAIASLCMVVTHISFNSLLEIQFSRVLILLYNNICANFHQNMIGEILTKSNALK
jgi:hypothetical protein